VPYSLENRDEEMEKLNEFAIQVGLARLRLDEITAELELYQDPRWGFFMDHLREEEDRALRAMIEGPTDTMILARERVKLLRYLAGTEERLIDERARLQEKINLLLEKEE